MARVYNFSAGPSMLPEKVLKQAQAELLEYGDSGQSVMEMSHRSKWFDAIIKDTEATLRRVMNIPDNYKVGFFQGGATQQFAMVPLNFMTTGKADYIVTGNFSNLAAKEAAKFGEANIVASSKDKNFTYIPDVNARVKVCFSVMMVSLSSKPSSASIEDEPIGTDGRNEYLLANLRE